MAALNMQGEHHVNTFLCQKKKKKKILRERFRSTPPFLLCLTRCWPRRTSKLKHVNRTRSKMPMVKQCDAKPGPFKNVKDDEEEETKLPPCKMKDKEAGRK